MRDEILDQGFRNSSAQDEAEASRLIAENFENKKRIGYGRGILVVIALVKVGFAIYQINNIKGTLLEGTDAGEIYTSEIIWETAIIAGFYLVCSIYSFYQPKIAFILALIGYVILIGLTILYAPNSLARGIFFKIFIMLYLGKAIQGSIQLEKNKARIFELRGF